MINVKPISKLIVFITGILLILLVGCNSSGTGQTNADANNSAADNSNPAIVDSVTVEQREGHFYAVVSGNYPDPCTFISSVNQVVEDNTIRLTLLTNSPADLMCAAVLTPFTVDILLTTGGLMPQEYTVVVNDGPSVTFTLGG